MKNQNKVAVRYIVAGCIFMILTVVLTGVMGMSSKVQGFRDAMNNYWAIWMPTKVASPLTYICLVILLFDICLLLATVIMSIAKHRPIFVFTSVCLFLAIAFLPFLFLLTFPQVEAGTMGRMGTYMLSGLTIMNIFAILLLVLGLQPVFQAGMDVIRLAAGGEKEEAAPAASAVEGLSEEEVRHIVEAYLKLHVDELHKEGEPVAAAPAEEKPVEEPAEEPAEEPEEEPEGDEDEEEVEEVEEVQPDGTVLKIKRKKRVPFENRLRKSVFDLRHKYYDLRDYIKWYGIKNRISIPGDTFSLKRKKYFFITIVGKHIKFYAAIDPAKYADSTMPVEQATAKRYEETPCVLRIKSDLSYRRAKQIVDEVMAENGFAKPEGPEPKETQHPEQE